MGRPRKPHQDEDSQSIDQGASRKWTGHHSANSHIAPGSHNVFPTTVSVFDQSFHFLEQPDQIAERARWNFGECIGFANMDDAGPQTAISVETSSSNSWSAHSLTQDRLDISSPKPPFPNSLACTCIDIIYLAMSSLREISADIRSSIQTVRSAIYSTQSVLRCPHCGIVVLTEIESPLEAFQNAMLLGSLFPTVIEAYKKLLTIVDVEANRAKAAGSSKVFRLSEYGGNLASYEACCERTALYENVEMDPDEWRRTVRALLRTDIYMDNPVRLVGWPSS